MIPEHCREVGVKHVDFELTEAEITSRFKERKLYTLTKYLVLHSGDNWAVCIVTKKDGFELFRNVVNIEIVSLPEETVFVEDPTVDVLNRSRLVTKAEEVSESTGARTVVVKGEFDHISFASGEELIPVVVLETVPPNPPKLVRLAERVIENGRLKQPVKLIQEHIRVDEIANSTEADTAVFPCQTSGLEALGKKTLYLDRLPELDEMEGKVVLFGCSLSDRIFKSHYHRKPELVNICPAEWVKNIREKYADHPILLKCCKVKEDYKIDGNVLKVPWGTTTAIIENALNDYFARMEEKSEG